MTVTVTDLFCGAGGSSLGAEAAGATLVMAANHWQTAIDVHQSNFPDAGHDCADISQADPRRYPRTNILLASPECTNHSQARGVSRRRQDPSLWDAPDPAAERSRATMWDVVRFAEQMVYEAIVVENVVEATKWVLWPSWVQALTDLGYEYTVLSHNSMHHAVPQSRDRIYVVWTRPGIDPDLQLELEAWCPRCESGRTVRQVWKNGRTVGRYRQQWNWGCIVCGAICDPVTEPAATIIDWSLECPRIGDRKRPLAKNTRIRILAGLQRYGWAPITTSGAVSDLDVPHPTVCASDDRQALVVHLRGTAPGQVANSSIPVTEPVRTVSAGGTHIGLLMRSFGNEGGDPGRHVTPTDEVLRTLTTNSPPALLMRNNTGGAEMVTPINEPARTMISKSHQSLLLPYNRDAKARSTADPTPTLTTRDHLALLDPEQAVDDCGFRMLEPYEVAAAMAFPTGYIPRDLTKKDQVKLAGNAVTPPVMTWIVGRIVQALEGEVR